MTPEPAGAISTGAAPLLLLAYAAFVVYGSFFPFQFRSDLDEVERDLARFWGTLALFDARGRRLFSIADLVSNLLLGAPVGMPLVRGRLVGEALHRRARAERRKRDPGRARRQRGRPRLRAARRQPGGARAARLSWHGSRARISSTGSSPPFDWLGTADQVAAKASRIEWIPLASYLHADPQSALFDLCGKLVWSGLFGAALRAAGARAPWAWGVGLAAALEGLQVLQRAHVPALTDVLTLGVGTALGAAVLGRYRRWRGAAAVSIAGH